MLRQIVVWVLNMVTRMGRSLSIRIRDYAN